ncbi:hypothetical protein L596_009768 [Steinernema carpocapsae]|uniref:Uncharacterized protein n=1 Tax=Steinernema carpocapsae TaxID=34508 RepID=A0A4U5PGA5_STECR|nr:hypothetical protein L596_009768 [Steinernema carpocapsae]
MACCKYRWADTKWVMFVLSFFLYLTFLAFVVIILTKTKGHEFVEEHDLDMAITFPDPACTSFWNSKPAIISAWVGVGFVAYGGLAHIFLLIGLSLPAKMASGEKRTHSLLFGP